MQECASAGARGEAGKLMVDKYPESSASKNLGLELAAELSSLHRYSRALFGARATADEQVRIAAEKALSQPVPPQHEAQPKLNLFQAFHDQIGAFIRLTWGGEQRLEVGGEGAKPWLAGVPLKSQQALLLTAVEGFTSEEAAKLLSIPAKEVRSRAEVARRHVGLGQTTRVLIVASQSEGLQIANVVGALGQKVIGPFENLSAAKIRTASSKPGLVIASASTPSQLKALNENYTCKIIYISSDPQGLLDSGVARKDIVSKPYNPGALSTVVAEALFHDLESTPEELVKEPQKGSLDNLLFEPALELSSSQLDTATLPQIGPVDAELVDGQLRLQVSPPPASKIELSTLNGLKEDHLRDMKRLLLKVSNLGPGFSARLETLVDLMSDDLTDQSAVRIGNQVSALDRMKGALDESLGDETASDVIAVIDSLTRFSQQFEIWREFLKEADAATELSSQERSALDAVATVMEQQSSEAISPELKDAIVELHTAQKEVPSLASNLALARAISNSLKAIARYFIARAKGAGTEFNKALEREIGEGLASGLTTVLVAASTPLLSLAVAMPAEFAWAGPILAIIRVASKK